MIFRYDNPFMRFMGIVGNLIWVNVLALLCCIPLVTVGASLTAAHFVSLRIVRGDDTNLTRSFFHSFGQNFRQATVIWIVTVLIGAVLAGDLYLIHRQIVTVPDAAEYVIYGVCIFVVLVHTSVYPILSKFENTVWGTVKNAFSISLLQLPQTILSAILLTIPFVLTVFFPPFFIFTMLFGISGPTCLSALMYNKLFAKLENPEALQEEPNNATAED